MIFLIVLGVIGLVAIVACVYAVVFDGYGPVRTRDAHYYRSTFDHAGFDANHHEPERAERRRAARER